METQQNEALERDVQRYLNYQQNVKKLLSMHAKLLWTERNEKVDLFESLKGEHDAAKERVKQIKAQIKEAEKEAEPLVALKREMDDTWRKLQSKVAEGRRGRRAAAARPPRGR